MLFGIWETGPDLIINRGRSFWSIESTERMRRRACCPCSEGAKPGVPTLKNSLAAMASVLGVGQMNEETTVRFANLFKGLDRAYGIYMIDGTTGGSDGVKV